MYLLLLIVQTVAMIVTSALMILALIGGATTILTGDLATYAASFQIAFHIGIGAVIVESSRLARKYFFREQYERNVGK